MPKSLEEGGTDATMKVRKNNWTVGVAGGQLSGTYMTFANEMAQVLDDGDNLRVIPIVTYGAASNLDDLLYLRQIDVAVTQADVFEYFRTQRKISNLEYRVNYIVRLPVSEVHVLARTDIKNIEDLRGKKVSFGPAGSASSLTGTIVFQRLGVQVEQVLVDNPTALQKLRSGEIAALVRVIGKPIDFFAKIPANAGLHLVPIPFSQDIRGLLHAGRIHQQRISEPGRRKDSPSTPSRSRRCSRCSIGRRATTATGALKGSPRACSPSGTSFASRRAIRNGATSIWRRPFPAGTAGAWRKRCCVAARKRKAREAQVADAEFSAFLKSKGSGSRAYAGAARGDVPRIPAVAEAAQQRATLTAIGQEKEGGL